MKRILKITIHKLTYLTHSKAQLKRCIIFPSNFKIQLCNLKGHKIVKCTQLKQSHCTKNKMKITTRRLLPFNNRHLCWFKVYGNYCE